MPAVDLVLQRVANGEQFAVARREIADDCSKSLPERVGIDSGFGRGFLCDEIEQNRGNLQSVGFDTLHVGLLKNGDEWLFFRPKTAKKRRAGAAGKALLAPKPSA